MIDNIQKDLIFMTNIKIIDIHSRKVVMKAVTESLVGFAVMLTIIYDYIETLKTDITVFIGNSIMCLMS